MIDFALCTAIVWFALGFRIALGWALCAVGLVALAVLSHMARAVQVVVWLSCGSWLLGAGCARLLGVG